MLADSYLLAVLDLVSDSRGLVALGANEHYLGRVHSALCLDSAAELTLRPGLNMLCYLVYALYDDLVFLCGYADNLALLAPSYNQY